VAALKLSSIVVVGSVLSIACSETPVVRNGPPQQRVISRAYGVAAADARRKILDAFARRPAPLPPPFAQFIAIELTGPSYPPDWLVTYTDRGGSLDDYKRLPPADRANDLWLREPTGDVYWLSEYALAGDNGAPVKFHCGLIVHFVPRGPALTEIQVYETVPTVWAGESWQISKHGPGFGKYHDIRFVEPTVSDRVRALDVLELLLGSGR